MREKRLMTPQEIQRTMDFILRSNADSVIRMDRMEEKWEKTFNAWHEEVQEALRESQVTLHETQVILRDTERISRKNTTDIRAVARANRAHEKRIRTLENSKRQTTKRAESTRDLMKILTRLAAVQSKRIDRLEGNGA